MNTKILVPVILVAGLGLAAASTFAATNTSTASTSALHQYGEGGRMGGRGMGGPGGGMGLMAQLTDAEKTAFEAMSTTEKQTYLDTKRAEADARRDAHEAVIDKLLAGTTLTADEEKVRQEIITQRAEMKVKRAEMDANREKMQAIHDKQIAGTALTTEEQALLDSMPRMGGRGGKDGNMRGMNTTRGTSTTSTK